VPIKSAIINIILYIMFMRKILLTGMVSVLFVLVVVSPAHAQTPSQDNQALISALLQQVALLQQQLLILQQKEALGTTTQDGAVITNVSNPIAVFDTTMGEIKIELFKDTMPITVGNFMDLAQDDFYNDTKFHRVIADFMIQGGDPISKTNDINRYGTGGPGYAIVDEHVRGRYLTNIRGTISMANSGPNSGGSQFFINLVDNTSLDFDKQPYSSKHPVFGHVISGMKVVDAIGKTKTNERDLPVTAVAVESITIQASKK
jgi:peptidylprolyl isomerase